MLGLDRARGLDEIDAIIVMFLDACRDRENIRIEDDVLRRKADLFDKDLIGALRYRDLALERVGLALFVEGHHHDCRAVAVDDLRASSR